MAKTFNIIEKKRSFFETSKFVIRESFRAHPFIAVANYVCSFLIAVTSFIEFGALASIVNEFTKYGIDGARMEKVFLSVLIMVFADFVPDALQFVYQAFSNTHQRAIGRHLAKLRSESSKKIDIGTIEQSEYQDMMELSLTRGQPSFISISSWSVDLSRYITQMVIASISLLIIVPQIFLMTVLGVLPTYIFQKREAKNTIKLWSMKSEDRRTWITKLNYLFKKESLLQLKSFDLIDIFSKKALSLMENFHMKVDTLEKESMYMKIFSKVILSLSIGASLILLINDVRFGVLAVGTLVFIWSVLFRFQSALTEIMRSAGRLVEHKKFVDTFMDYLETKPMVETGKEVLPFSGAPKIEFRNVSFMYPGATKMVLENVNLVITPGSHLAIVGLNGAGKTTFIKLLMRVYDPTEGVILINDQNLKSLDLSWWHKQLAIMMQDYTIFQEDTIEQNILYGNLNTTNFEGVQVAAQQSTADTFIDNLTEKYQQKIGTEFRGGVELSKGQKQKLALSRVFYRETPIVILDEPTAAVDSISEDTIFKNLLSHKTENKTLIMISHKFSNVRTADKIILIKDTNILENGTHDELIGMKGEYAKLFELQAKGYQ